jgi:hypothetical protein
MNVPGAVFGAIDLLDITQTITNPRITALDGSSATPFARVEARRRRRLGTASALRICNGWRTATTQRRRAG